MSEMVERVALVLWQQNQLDMYGKIVSDGFDNDYIKERFTKSAVAAIEAMRGPDTEMIDAACVAWVDLHPAFEGEKPPPTAGEVVTAVFNAAIGAALKSNVEVG